MHRELKRETTCPAPRSFRAQQRRLDAYRTRYNDERPHEGIGDQTSASTWKPSPRPYAERITPPIYAPTWKSVWSAALARFDCILSNHS